MANAASLFLPGSNLTNLLVEGGQISGLSFVARTWPAALVATAVTAAGLLLFAANLVRSVPQSGTGGTPFVRAGTEPPRFAPRPSAWRYTQIGAPLGVAALGLATLSLPG